MAMLDEALKPQGGRDGDDLQGSGIEWPEVEPPLLDEISGLISQYLYLPKPMADAVALWSLTTWIHDRLEISTFLNVTSATKRCGKSLLMEMLAELVHRPLQASGRVTPAALFRIIEKQSPTLLLDEAGTFFADDTRGNRRTRAGASMPWSIALVMCLSFLSRRNPGAACFRMNREPHATPGRRRS